MSGCPERTADVRAEFQRHEPGGKGCGGATRGPTGCVSQSPRIIGGAVNVVEALPVSEPYRHIGLADDDRSGSLEALHDKGIDIWAPLAGLWVSPGRRQSGDIELLLYCHRQAE